MSSSLTWLDSSEHDRRRALDVIDLFAVRDTRDELGLAGVRDAWADRLVPGTSTIQTRARYFFFVPWMYQRLARAGKGSADIERAARKYEIRLVEAITSTDQDGVPIGARAGRGLKRLPSAIYWNGLKRLGICFWLGSQPAFHRGFGATIQSPWHPHLPPAPADFPNQAVLRLEEAESEFLRNQVRAQAPDSLLAFLMEQLGFVNGVRYPWEHPDRIEMPQQLSGWLDHAESFAVVMHGSALLYNRMLAELLSERGSEMGESKVAEYEERFRVWAEDIEAWRSSTGNWDRHDFWRLTREVAPQLPTSAESFCEAWIDRTLNTGSPSSLIGDKEARRLIENREVRLKRNRSRLKYSEHLERWGGAAGVGRIDYRWGITQRLVRDVQEGLGQA